MENIVAEIFSTVERNFTNIHGKRLEILKKQCLGNLCGNLEHFWEIIWKFSENFNKFWKNEQILFQGRCFVKHTAQILSKIIYKINMLLS